MRTANEWHFFVGQDGDAQIAFALTLIGVVAWAFTMGLNLAWLRRANGERPFVRMALFVNSIFLILALSFAINTSYLQSISDDTILRLSFWGNRLLVGVAAPFGTWQLRRGIDKRRQH
jgi:hypothetical protein